MHAASFGLLGTILSLNALIHVYNALAVLAGVQAEEKWCFCSFGLFETSALFIVIVIANRSCC